MKKQFLSLLSFFCLIAGSNAQEEKPANLRHPCNTFEAMEEGFKADPKLKAQFEAAQAQFQIEYEKNLASSNSVNKTTAATYTIPIVFHIMGTLNITDQVFVNLVSYFNRDYAKLGADTTTINPAFANLYKDSGIRFALAQRDPTGKCTNGVIRHPAENMYWQQSSPNYKFSGTGTNRWPTNQYLNIYIVECIASATYPCPTTTGAYIGGYTYLPGSTPYSSNGNMGDAIVLLRNQLAQTNPLDSRTISHEIGHWLNLSHTFGSSNNPKFDPSNMPTSPISCSTDNVADTPPTGGYFSICTTSTLDCSNPPNIENIMDYASCPKMFTQGQITRMQTALGSTTGGRNNLWTAANYAATGLTPGFTCTPVADLNSNKTRICAGNSITYTSESYVGTSGGVNWVFEGGSPSTSTSSNPVVTYATPGTYSVSITATNSIGSNTMNKTSYVTVTDVATGTVLPSAFDFQTTGLPTNISVINPDANAVLWGQNTTTGGNSTTKSIYLNNFSGGTTISGNIDIFETPLYNFSNTSNITMSYYYAYAKKVAAQLDTFKIQYSLDCGGSWTNIPGIPSTAQMSTASGGTVATSFTPTSAQWIIKNIVSGLLTNLVNKPSVIFRFYFRVDPSLTSANNMYIDQINIIGNVTTAITELEKSLELAIYPNPTNSSAAIDFSLYNNEKVKIKVTDLVGRVVEESGSLTSNSDKYTYTVNKNNTLAKGVYIVTLDVNNQHISKKLIIE